MPPSFPSLAFRYSLSVFAVAVATLLRLALNPLVGNRQPFVLYFLAVIFASWACGLGPTIAATILGAVAALFFFIPPYRVLRVNQLADVIGLGLYLTICAVIAALSEANRRARHRLEAKFVERREQDATIGEQRGLAEFGRDIGLALTEADEIGPMLDRCCALTVRHLDGAFARIWTVDAAGETLELRASAGMYTHLDGPHARVPVGKYKIGTIARDRTPHLTNAVVGDPLVPAQEWASREGMVAFAGYPLIVEDRLLGVWAMFARHTLSDATLTAMESVARGIALGIRRKQAGKAEAEGAAWLWTTLRSIGDAVIATDCEGRVRFLNPVAEGLTGWPQDEARGRPMDEVLRLVDEPTRRPAESPVRRVIREGRVVGLANHTILVARDGTEVPIEDSAAPIRDGDDRISGVVMVFRDVTGEKQARRLVLESEARKAAILESAIDGIITVDHEGKVLEFNPASERMFGRNRGDVLGLSIREIIIPPSLRDAHRRGMEHFNATGEGPILGKRVEVPALRADGSEFPIELAVTRIPTPGPPMFTAHIRDITEKKAHAEERDRLLAEAQGANQAKTHFLAMLSHELRTPLNPILLAVTSMLEHPVPAEEVRPNLEMIREYVNLQSRLIDDLLDVMRIVQGKMPLHWEVADGHQLIQRAIHICRSEVHAKGLKIDTELNADARYINADPARLQQVFWNLIKNAVKFTPAGGSIAIRTRNSEDGRLAIEVADTGIGIEPDLLDRIFDPFQQGESSITRRFGGLGLGLAICKGIVDGHGGVLAVESRGKGQGTTFRVELATMPDPRLDPASTPVLARAVPAEPAALAPRRILLVEDEQATIRLMARLLRSLGHRVATASSIQDALEEESQGEFDLIVSDIGLPDGSGLELMRRVVARRGPVQSIALTGYGMEEDIQRSRDAGFTAHMTKPIDFAKLEALIRQLSESAA